MELNRSRPVRPRVRVSTRLVAHLVAAGLRACRRPPARPALLTACLTAISVVNGCRPPSSASAPPAAPIDDTARFSPAPIGAPFTGAPWISHLVVADLDRDGRRDVLACDDKLNAVVWLRQTAPGKFAESTLADGLTSPVHVEPVDLDGDGDLDLLVACMGEVFPNNDKIGSVVILENDGRQNFTKHIVAERIARVTDLRAADFNHDGRLDLAVAQFGYDQGEIRWMENLGGWQFKSHHLLDLSGTINVCVADLTGAGHPDIAAVVSQQWEEIYLFQNDGHGNFTNKILFGSTNEDFGSSGISLCDLNRDGRPDILYTNGDGFASADPGGRPWHGVQWLENRGDGFFKFHRIGNLPGAFSPLGVDLDGDGHTDVVCLSAFNEWRDPKAASIVAWMNDGHEQFTPHILAHAPIQQITCAAGDLDGTGRPALVTGGFYAYPPFDRMARLTLWRPKK
jgi:hypothetical protein